MNTDGASHPSAWTRAVSSLAARVVIVVGGAVLIGWMLDIALVKSVFPGLVAMKSSTALALALSGVSL